MSRMLLASNAGDEQNRRLAQVVRELRREIQSLKGGATVKAEDELDMYHEDGMTDVGAGGGSQMHQAASQQLDAT